MAKYNFDTLQDFKDYVEKYFSKNRNLNYGDDQFTLKECKKKGDVAYLIFDVNPDFDSIAVATRIKAKDEWLGFFPKFSHHALKEIPEKLNEVNNRNHENRPERHSPSQEKLEQEPQNWETIQLD